MMRAPDDAQSDDAQSDDTKSDDTKSGVATNRLFRALSALERAGNKLPHPFWLFVILSLVLGSVSAVLSFADVRVTLPASGEVVAVQNLFSVDGAKFAIESALTNYAEFPPLATIVVVLLGVSVAERSGLLTALLHGTVGRLPVGWLTFAISLSSMISHVMSDSAYLIMMPLGALAFRAAGRSPLLGLMVAYAATAVGFNVSPLVTPQDAIRSTLSMAAAGIVDPNYTITPLATYFFTAASSIVLSAAIALVVDRVLARRPEFGAETLEQDFRTADHLFNKSSGSDDTPGPGASTKIGPAVGRQDIEMSAKDVRALWTTGAVFLVCAAGIVAMLLPGSPFLGEGGSIVESVVVENVAVFISVIFGLLGIVHGRITGTIPRLGDVPVAMAEGVRSLVPVLVLFFAVAQFLAYFTWTNIGSVISVHGAEMLRSLQVPHLALLLIVVLAISCLNILITSGSAMWSILAPVVIPMTMYLGMRPEAAMAAFMIGDSVTNCVSPLNGYFVLALGFVQQFRKGAGVGTLLSFTLPIAVVVLVVWTAFFAVWYQAGIPLGPGVSVR